MFPVCLGCVHSIHVVFPCDCILITVIQCAALLMFVLVLLIFLSLFISKYPTNEKKIYTDSWKLQLNTCLHKSIFLWNIKNYLHNFNTITAATILLLLLLLSDKLCQPANTYTRPFSNTYSQHGQQDLSATIWHFF